jgi:DNA (cytosine-5)-methyltransferase 1
LAELGYGFAYRVLDAKNFGVPQRRRRVFVVGYLGDWRPPAQVLFESESVCRDTQTCGDSGKNTTANVGAGTQAYGIPGNWIGRKPENGGNATEPMHDIAPCLTSADQHSVVYRKLSLTSYVEDESASTICSRDHKSVTDIVVYEHHPADSRVKAMGQTCSTVTARWGTGGGNTPLVAHTAVVYDMKQHHNPQESRDVQLTTENCSKIRGDSPIVHQSSVRRLTPVECERLQGFPGNYTNIPWRKSDESPDGLRYKALGNSMAVPVMKWIGERIAKSNQIKGGLVGKSF